MAKLLYFRGQLVGDGVVNIAPDAQAATPAVVQTGLYRATAGLNADSANLLYAVEIAVHFLKTSPEALTLAIQAVQALVNLSGDVLVKTDGSTTLRGTNWVLTRADRPPLMDGFGGRFADRWVLRFEGVTALTAS